MQKTPLALLTTAAMTVASAVVPVVAQDVPETCKVTYTQTPVYRGEDGPQALNPVDLFGNAFRGFEPGLGVTWYATGGSYLVMRNEVCTMTTPKANVLRTDAEYLFETKRTKVVSCSPDGQISEQLTLSRGDEETPRIAGISATFSAIYDGGFEGFNPADTDGKTQGFFMDKIEDTYFCERVPLMPTHPAPPLMTRVP